MISHMICHMTFICLYVVLVSLKKVWRVVTCVENLLQSLKNALGVNRSTHTHTHHSLTLPPPLKHTHMAAGILLWSRMSNTGLDTGQSS